MLFNISSKEKRQIKTLLDTIIHFNPLKNNIKTPYFTGNHVKKMILNESVSTSFLWDALLKLLYKNYIKARITATLFTKYANEAISCLALNK